MSGYRNTEQYVLIDLLSKLTADHTRLLTENGDQQQVNTVYNDIIAIQKEISLRQKLSRYSNASTDFILCTHGDII